MAYLFKDLVKDINTKLIKIFVVNEDELHGDENEFLDEYRMKKGQLKPDRDPSAIAAGLVAKYHSDLQRGLESITRAVKAKTHTQAKSTAEFNKEYRTKLLSELYKAYPEIRSIMHEGRPTDKSFSIVGTIKAGAKPLENHLDTIVQKGLKSQRITLPRVKETSVALVTSHFNSVGMQDATESRLALVSAKQEEKLKPSVKTKESDATLKSVMSLTNNQPGNWVITSGMFSGKKVNDLVDLLFDNTPEGDALALLKKKLRLDELDITKAQVKLKDAKTAVKVSLDRVGWGNRAGDLEGLLANPHALKNLPANVIKGIKAVLATEDRIGVKSSAYEVAEAAYKVRYRPYHQLRMRAATWFLDKHVTLIANPKAFERTFGRTSASRNSGLSPAFVSMFKHVFTEGGLLKHALNVKGITLAQEEDRENDSFYQTLQYYTDRKGIAKKVIVTKYLDPRKNEGGGAAVSDQGEKESENIWEKTSSPGRGDPKNTPGQYATGRIYNRDKTRMTDKEVSERRRQEDIGMVGRHSLMRGLRLGMNVHDRVRYDKLQEALDKMPRRTTKEWVTNPLTGEKKMMRKGSELGMMMAYDKHGKLVWREFDIYGGARRSLRGQLRHLTEKEVERQGIKGYGEDKEVEMINDKLTGGPVDLTKMEKRGVGKDGKGKGRTGAQAEQAEENEKILQDGGKDPVITGREMLDKRDAYANMIKNAKTEDHLKEVERRIYNSMNKKKEGTEEHAIRENKLAREQLDKFREGSDLLPDFYGDTAPLLSMQDWRKMYSGTLKESNAVIENFVSEQTAYYSNKQGPGQAVTLENKFRSEYHSVDYQLPIATQIAVRKMEFRNSGNKP